MIPAICQKTGSPGRRPSATTGGTVTQGEPVRGGAKRFGWGKLKSRNPGASHQAERPEVKFGYSVPFPSPRRLSPFRDASSRRATQHVLRACRGTGFVPAVPTQRPAKYVLPGLSRDQPASTCSPPGRVRRKEGRRHERDDPGDHEDRPYGCVPDGGASALARDDAVEKALRRKHGSACAVRRRAREDVPWEALSARHVVPERSLDTLGRREDGGQRGRGGRLGVPGKNCYRG